MQGNGKDIPTAPAACIDAETLAAWADGGLSKSESAAVEVHLADCERCTAMLATFARTIPPTPATESLWNRWHLRWLVPVATAATVVSLYVLIPRQPTPRIAELKAPTTETETRTATETPAEPAPSTAQLAPSPAQPEAPSRQAKEQDSFAKREESQRAAQQSADDKRADAAANAALRGTLNETVQVPAQTAQELDRVQRRRAEDRTEQFSPPVGAVSPPPASAPVTVAGATPAVSAETGARERGFSSAARSSQAMFEIVSPNPATRWRVSGAGQVERSTNGGAQWERATLPEAATLTGGSSPSPSVCWLAGRSGAIYVTTDGLRFTRVPFPDRTDFVSIQATDPRRVTVVTIDGRTMRTEDQGATWIRIAP